MLMSVQVFTENKFVMCAFAACAVIVIARVVYTVLNLAVSMFYVPGSPFSPQPPMFTPLLYVNVATVAVLMGLNIVTSIYFAVVWRDFGWKMYKTVGANKSLVCTSLFR